MLYWGIDLGTSACRLLLVDGGRSGQKRDRQGLLRLGIYDDHIALRQPDKPLPSAGGWCIHLCSPISLLRRRESSRAVTTSLWLRIIFRIASTVEFFSLPDLVVDILLA